MRIKTKNFIILILLLCLSASIFTGCCDLADVEDEEEYYAIFGEIYTVIGSNSDSYSMSDFYNKETVDKMKSPIEQKQYNYLAIKSSEDFSLDEIAMYIRGSEKATVAVNMYKYDSMPSVPSDAINPYLDTFNGVNNNKNISIRLYEEDSKNLVEYKENELTGTGSFSYNDDKTKVEFIITIGMKPYGFEVYVDYLGLHVTNTTSEESYLLASVSSGNKIATVAVSASPDEWSSFLITKFNYDGKTGQNQIEIKEDDFIVFEFLNNDASASLYGLKHVGLEATNILIRIKKNKE